MSEMTPREIVSELDSYIIGQHSAKRAVAIALRNRWRRMQLGEALRHEVTPKNILMIGPTGVGKTEIARRLAKLANAPFIKVEATKFTEVGYVGKEVDSIIRDLTDSAMKMIRAQSIEKNRYRAEEMAGRAHPGCIDPAGQEQLGTGRTKQRELTGTPEFPQEAARGRAGRQRDRDRTGGRTDGCRNHGASRHGRDDQPTAIHVPELGRAKDQAAQD